MVNPRINLNTSIFWGWLITTDSCQFWGWFYHGPWPANALNTNVTPLPGPEVLLSDSRGSGKRSIGKAWRSWLPQAATMLEHDRACGGYDPWFFLESSDHAPSTHQHAQHWPINQDLQRVKSHPVLPKVNRATTKPRLSDGVSRVSDAVATPLKKMETCFQDVSC